MLVEFTKTALCLWLLFSSVNVLAENLCFISKEAISEASLIRGLKALKDVPCLSHSKAEIKKAILQSIKEKIPDSKLKAEESLYKILGLLPEDFNYKKGIVDLYLSQLGGYYDPKRDFFVMADWIPAQLQITVAIHELTHALQDQHFNLDAITDNVGRSTDELLARTALIEGDATAVMLDYSRLLSNMPKLSEENDVSSFIFSSTAAVEFLSQNSNVPQSMKAFLIFPYTTGLKFVHFLLKRGGYKEVNKAYKRLPGSTEEILHPEKYLAKKRDYIIPTLPDSFSNLPMRYKDTIGEFGVSVLCSQHLKGSKMCLAAANGWGGDRVGLYYANGGKAAAVLWKTSWDSKNDAEEFFLMMKDLLSKRYGPTKSTSKEALSFASKGVKAFISKEKARVTVVFNRNP
ncbi:MAG: hypothetical protein D6808_05510 [Candidatus Dadabacteria bacterium]|nr:MAG: hypothetical protein D6808_05510 [Candidatus Dadabacteria bacterium]